MISYDAGMAKVRLASHMRLFEHSEKLFVSLFFNISFYYKCRNIAK